MFGQVYGSSTPSAFTDDYGRTRSCRGLNNCVGSNMATGWSNEETFKFIELYQTYPEIWNPKHKYHKDKNKVSDALVRTNRRRDADTSKRIKKKDTLLAAFHLYHKKVVASRKSGVGENDVHKPILIYDAMAAFMSDVYGWKLILATEDSADVKKDADGIADTQPSPRPQQSVNLSQVSIPLQKRRSNNPPKLAETSAQMKSALSTPNDALTAKKNRVEKVVKDDDCDLYGRLLARALREFNEIDRLELRYEIDGLIIKKRSLISRRCVTSPSQIILSTNRPSTSDSTFSEKMTDDYPSSPYVIHRPPSSRSMYSSPSPSPKRIHNQQNISRHVYAVASPPCQQDQSSNILLQDCLNADI